MTSALRRMAASSKEVRVRVLGSTKKLTSVLPRKRRDLLDFARADLLEGVGRIENEIDFLRGELAQAEQVFACPAPRCSLLICVSTARRHPVHHRRFSRRTRTRSLRAVGRFLPT